MDEGLVDGRHNEVRDATTGITNTASQSIRRPDNVLVEEASRPDLARHE